MPRQMIIKRHSRFHRTVKTERADAILVEYLNVMINGCRFENYFLTGLGGKVSLKYTWHEKNQNQ
jgi:hypothetical protein